MVFVKNSFRLNRLWINGLVLDGILKKYRTLKRETENGLVVMAETDVFLGIMAFFSSLKPNQNLEHLSVWMDGKVLE